MVTAGVHVAHVADLLGRDDPATTSNLAQKHHWGRVVAGCNHKQSLPGNQVVVEIACEILPIRGNEAVREGGLAVVDMREHADVANLVGDALQPLELRGLGREDRRLPRRAREREVLQRLPAAAEQRTQVGQHRLGRLLGGGHGELERLQRLALAPELHQRPALAPDRGPAAGVLLERALRDGKASRGVARGAQLLRLGDQSLGVRHPGSTAARLAGFLLLLCACGSLTCAGSTAGRHASCQSAAATEVIDL